MGSGLDILPIRYKHTQQIVCDHHDWTKRKMSVSSYSCFHGPDFAICVLVPLLQWVTVVARSIDLVTWYWIGDLALLLGSWVSVLPSLALGKEDAHTSYILVPDQWRLLIVLVEFVMYNYQNRRTCQWWNWSLVAWKNKRTANSTKCDFYFWAL